ncbi:MAG: hypothetical protein QXI16_01065 [Sulfolobaceae archaeon]
MKKLINEYNGMTGLEYARATLNEQTSCVWHLENRNGLTNIFYEGEVVNPSEMLCIQTWVVEKVERIGNKDHVYLNENDR